MSLFTCGFTVDCTCALILRAPEYLTMGLFLTSFFYYDVTFFWFGVGLMLNYTVNVVLNAIIHPFSGAGTWEGRPGFLNNPSFPAQFCTYVGVLFVLFYHSYHIHVPGFLLAFLYTIILVILYADARITTDSDFAMYLGAGIGVVMAVLSIALFIKYLDAYSEDLAYSWFGKWWGLRNSIATRYNLESQETHERMSRVMEAGGFTSYKEAVNFIQAFNGLADTTFYDPVYRADPDDEVAVDEQEIELNLL